MEHQRRLCHWSREPQHLVLLEWITYNQVAYHLIIDNILPEFQSVYQSWWLTETVVLKVFWDLVYVLDKGQYAVLSVFYLLAAFDTVDYNILLHRLSVSFRFDGTMLNWFRSYLEDCMQSVHLDSKVNGAMASYMWRSPGVSFMSDFLHTVYCRCQEIFCAHQL